MRKSVVVTLAALGLVGAATMAAPKTVAAKLQAGTFEGYVTIVNVKSHDFVVKGTQKGEASEMTFTVGPESRIMIDGERKLLSQLERGDHVVVTYETREGRQVTEEVRQHHKTTS